MLLIGGLLAVVFMKAPGRANSPLFGRGKSGSTIEDRPAVTFGDVAGVDEAKVELQEIVTFLREPERFTRIGARTPKGVLLVGPPGTGKTLLAKAIAGESRVPFFNMSGSEFVEMYVGVGASRVRKLFAEAKKHSPSIVFIDEIDAVGRHRDAAVHSHNSEREQTLNQILVEIDGFGSDSAVIVVAATNRADVLDTALLRPGRFDRQVTLSAPDVKGREETFLVHLKGKQVDETVSAHDLARATPGFVGADIENVVNEAAILAVRANRDVIGQAEFEAAIERVMAGPEKRGRIISDEERLVVAYHETGHAVAAHVLPQCDPVRKVSIVARGAAAGYTMTLPEQDHMLLTSTKLRNEMAFMLGGRAAEEVLLGEVTTGASSDLMRATEVARRMVMEYGMSAQIGPLSYARGSGVYEQDLRGCSESQAAQIDQEVKRLVDDAYECARSVIGQNRYAIESIVAALLVQETLSGDEFRAVFDNACS
jgi:cell division protease FtsH